MLKNYFVIAGRSTLKHKSYTLISIIGLAFGICTCIVIFLVTDYKFTSYNFDGDGNRIYRVVGAIQNCSRSTDFLNTGVSDVALKDHVAGLKLKEGLGAHDCSTGIANVNGLFTKFNNDDLCNRR